MKKSFFPIFLVDLCAGHPAYRYCGMYLLSVLALAPACGTSFLYMRCNRNKIRLASWVIYRMLVSSNTVCHHGTCITENALQQNYIVETMKHSGNIHVLCYIDGTLFHMVITVYRSKRYIGLENSVGKDVILWIMWGWWDPILQIFLSRCETFCPGICMNYPKSTKWKRSNPSQILSKLLWIC